MGFVMATFYLVNWPDDDIRQIALEVKLSLVKSDGMESLGKWHVRHMFAWRLFCSIACRAPYEATAPGEIFPERLKRIPLKEHCNVVNHPIHYIE